MDLTKIPMNFNTENGRIQKKNSIALEYAVFSAFRKWLTARRLRNVDKIRPAFCA